MRVESFDEGVAFWQDNNRLTVLLLVPFYSFWPRYETKRAGCPIGLELIASELVAQGFNIIFVDACMAAALVFDKVKGLVEHDQSRCVGCWMCVMVCPYGAIRPNIKSKMPVRCDKCKDKDEPACVKACPTQAVIWQEEEVTL